MRSIPLTLALLAVATPVLADATPPAERGPAAAAPTAPGYLICNTTPWARVFVDGKDTGKSTPIAPRQQIALAPGRHLVTFLVGELRHSYTITIASGETVRLVKDLTPSQPAAAPTRYTIAVTRDGAILLHNAPHSDAMVVTEFRGAVSTGAQVEVVLAMDKDVPHGRAVAVMDLVRAAGVTRLSLAVQPAH